MTTANQTDKSDKARMTFYTLRTGMIVMVLMLISAVALQVVATDRLCWLTSISAYYYTPVQPMFVGTLCAIGISLIAYQGRTDSENILLDYSGFLAFIVAFVPTGFEKGCSAQETDVSAAVTNNVIPLMAAGLVVTVWACRKWWGENGDSRPDDKAKTNAKWVLGAVLVVTALLVAVGTTLFFTSRQLFEANAHGVAAYALFGGIFLVVLVNVARKVNWFKKGFKVSSLPRIGYFWVAVIMLLTVLLFLVLYLGLDIKHAVFGVEAAMIIEFAVFWILQTRELRKEQVR